MTKPTAAVTAATSMASITWRQGRWMYLRGERSGGAGSAPAAPRGAGQWAAGRPHGLEGTEGCAGNRRAAAAGPSQLELVLELSPHSEARVLLCPRAARGFGSQKTAPWASAGPPQEPLFCPPGLRRVTCDPLGTSHGVKQLSETRNGWACTAFALVWALRSLKRNTAGSEQRQGAVGQSLGCGQQEARGIFVRRLPAVISHVTH